MTMGKRRISTYPIRWSHRWCQRNVKKKAAAAYVSPVKDGAIGGGVERMAWKEGVGFMEE